MKNEKCINAEVSVAKAKDMKTAVTTNANKWGWRAKRYGFFSCVCVCVCLAQHSFN